MTTDQPDDRLPDDIEAFIAALLNSSERDWDQLQRYVHWLARRHCVGRLSPGKTVEDVAQDVMRELVKGALAKFRGIPADMAQGLTPSAQDVVVRRIFKGFLMSIMLNVVRGHGRQAHRTPKITDELLVSDEPTMEPQAQRGSSPLMQLAAPGPSLFEQVMMREELDQVVEKIAQLHALGGWQQTRIEWFLLATFADWPYKHIAANYGCSWTRVRDAIHEVRDQLKRIRTEQAVTKPPTGSSFPPAVPPHAPNPTPDVQQYNDMPKKTSRQTSAEQSSGAGSDAPARVRQRDENHEDEPSKEMERPQ